MFWHCKTQRWLDNKKKGANVAVAGTQPPAAPSAPPSPAPTNNQLNNADKAGRDLALTNASHQINLAMQGLLNVFKES
jgi:hypothetical protein